jgi:hypothetical protein
MQYTLVLPAGQVCTSANHCSHVSMVSKELGSRSGTSPSGIAGGSSSSFTLVAQFFCLYAETVAVNITLSPPKGSAGVATLGREQSRS